MDLPAFIHSHFDYTIASLQLQAVICEIARVKPTAQRVKEHNFMGGASPPVLYKVLTAETKTAWTAASKFGDAGLRQDAKIPG